MKENTWKIIIFIFIWFGYGILFVSRRPYGIIKNRVQEEFELDVKLLGYMDLTFLLPYSIMTILFSYMTNKISPHVWLSVALIATSFASLLVVFVKKYWQFLICILINGVFQSVSWPCCCAILSSWFPNDKLNIVFAIFNTSAIVGGIVSSIITVSIEAHYGWHAVFWVPFGACLIIGVLIVVVVRKPEENREENNSFPNGSPYVNPLPIPLSLPAPLKEAVDQESYKFGKEEDRVNHTTPQLILLSGHINSNLVGYLWRRTILVGGIMREWGWPLVARGMGDQKALTGRMEDHENSEQQNKEENKMKDAKKISLLQIIRIPVIIEISVALFFIKAARTASLSWTSYYFIKVLNYTTSQAGLISMSSEIGAAIGSIVISVVLDKLFKGRDIIASIFLNLGCGVVFLILNFTITMSTIVHIILLVTPGAFMCMSELIIGATVPTQIGEEHNAVTSVTGFVNGIASLGGVAQGLIISYVSQWLGTESFAYITAIFFILASLISIRIHLLRKKINQNRSGNTTTAA